MLGHVARSPCVPSASGQEADGEGSLFLTGRVGGGAGGNAGREGAGMLFLKDKIEKEREKDRRKGMDRESKRAFFHGKL